MSQEGDIDGIGFALAAAGIDRIISPKEASVMTNRSLSSMWRDSQAGLFVKK